MTDPEVWDYIIVGSGFGGSVSALRLCEKGYRVLVLEKGRRLEGKDFPKTNWNLKRWMWLPTVGFRGLFKMTFLRHITALSGVGVGGGSLVYANTLPIPNDTFFKAPSWNGLADWRAELGAHYQTARKMLGAAPHPYKSVSDEIIESVGKEMGRPEQYSTATVAVYFGKPGQTVEDPYFGGKGPPRTGCNQCGGCMLGCRHNAKNTLDKNYLYLAERLGLVIQPNSEVVSVSEQTGTSSEQRGRYSITVKSGDSGYFRKLVHYQSNNVIFSGGVLGTVDLLLRMREKGLPKLSAKVGHFVRTNSEVLMGVISEKRDVDYSKGIAIGSILHTDDHSHVEPVRYPAGSGFFRMMMMPHAPGQHFGTRLLHAFGFIVKHPIKTIRFYTVPDLAKNSMILLYMRTLDGHLTLRRKRGILSLFRSRLGSVLADGPKPTASIPEATEIGERVAKKISGTTISMATETLFGIPTTAHILGGCVMGRNAEEGVIDAQHRVFGYDGLYVIDGSSVSANPGVNPSLTITALAERAMSFIPSKPKTS